MLVCHAVDDYTTSSSSSEVCHSERRAERTSGVRLVHYVQTSIEMFRTNEHSPSSELLPGGVTCPAPERYETEVSMTVCTASMMAVLGRIATARQIAPWSKDLTCQSHHTVGAAFWSTSVGGLAHFQSDMGIAQRRKLAERTPRKLGSALSYSAGHGYGPAELWTCQTLARRALRKVTDSISADRHLEIASPT